MVTWLILLSVPIAVLAERALDPDARRAFRAWRRLRKIKALPAATPRALQKRLITHWEHVLDQALKNHKAHLKIDCRNLAAGNWADVQRARRELELLKPTG